ncbi:anti-anti-sigma factor [Roseovarius indicus]|uniref:Anti-anti-sigma factor n=2 Tax=Roseovarius indicus TaxID=540747 RepID=A0A5P3ACL0_9RHOB|nr:STAS domain-containing protein [Roseovarius indicus]QEW27097.1 anti-anti-sigma factor [Roseovarius indicus]SFD54263.1 anti-anti-sigma factor [Roseovarius indicus]
MNTKSLPGLSDPMHISITTLDDILVAELSGALTCMAAGPVYDALVRHVDETACRLIVDMSGVTRLTRAGVRGLVVAAKLCVTHGGKMRICGADASATLLLTSLGFRHILKLEPSVEAAVMALGDTADTAGAGVAPVPENWPDGSVTRTQFAEINRVEHARYLIAEAELPFEFVARTCGFDSAKAMGCAFLRHLGIPPSYFAERAATAREMSRVQMTG